MGTKYLLVILILFTHGLCAQSTKIDSLRKLLEVIDHENRNQIQIVLETRNKDSLKILSELQIKRCSLQLDIYKNLCDEFLQDLSMRNVYIDSFGKYQQKALEMEGALNLFRTQRELNIANNDLRLQKKYSKFLLIGFILSSVAAIFLFVQWKARKQ